MRQLMASVIVAVLLVGGWSKPGWSAPEGELTAMRKRHQQEREKIRAEMEKRKQQSNTSPANRTNQGGVRGGQGGGGGCPWDDPFCDLPRTP